MAAHAQGIEWILRAEDTERRVPVSPVIVADDEFWRMKIEVFDPSEGLRISQTSAEVHADFVFDAHLPEQERRLFGNVMVSGGARLEFVDGAAVELGPANSALFLPAERRGSYALRPQRDFRHAAYSVRDDRLYRMFGDDMPDTIAATIMGDDAGSTRLVETATSAGMRRLAASLFDEKLHGALRLIYMESVALQLMVLQAAATSRRDAAAAISRRDRASLLAARERLLVDIADPPSLATLSGEANMSERALNSGFRALFGGTVYEVLRDERLAHARLALEMSNAPIKQIAHRVGYMHVSNFTAAFARRYGVPPRRFRGIAGGGDNL